MPSITPHEKRTIQIAAAGLGIYLALFYGVRAWKQSGSSGSQYRALVQEAERLKIELAAIEPRSAA